MRFSINKEKKNDLDIIKLSKIKFFENFNFVKWLYVILTPLNRVDQKMDPVISRICAVKNSCAQKTFLLEIKDNKLQMIYREIGKTGWKRALEMIDVHRDELFEEHFIPDEIQEKGFYQYCLKSKCKDLDFFGVI